MTDLAINMKGALQLTFESERLIVCDDCKKLHVRLTDRVTPLYLRNMAATVSEMAEELEAKGMPPEKQA